MNASTSTSLNENCKFFWPEYGGIFPELKEIAV
jgi:hypothetical protein